MSEQPFERVLVVGAGTIGSLLAGHLAGQAEVSVLTRRPEHAEALNENGLRILGKSDLLATVTASADPARLPDFDLAILATKTTGVEAGIAGLAGRCPGATVMTVQNGLGSEEVVRRHGAWRIISGVTFISGIRHSDAVIEYELDTETWMGPYAGTATPLELAQAAGDLFAAAGLNAEVLPDLLPAQWSKLIFNAAVNGAAALTELPHVALFAKRDAPSDLGHLVYDLIAEGKAVAAAAGVELHDDPWEMNQRAVTRGESDEGDYAHPPSMLDDVLAHRATEVDAITGALVREAERVGVPLPLNTAVYRLIKAKEESWTLPTRRIQAPPSR
ncbi:MAG TPA: ketopantoate reductase family protein [Solirubrobacterales bacterium]|nr:ketopantoate reductase family protein [Solirubrobacterales bacterium]